MNNFNLLVSSSRFNETNVKAELWFTLLMCGDKYPIISDLEYSGLIAASTSLNAKEVIEKIKNTLKKDSYFFQYLLKIIPIDFVCEANVQMISEVVKLHYKEYINNDESFKIDLNRRNSDIIERNVLIDSIAKNIENRVDLKNPDKTIRIELLYNYCGVSFLKSDDILDIKNRYNKP